MATVTSYGAAQEVTGSCHLVEAEGLGKVLLDCGMHQGNDVVDRIREEHFDFDPATIEAVIVSHGHLDHSGLLPRLFAAGYNGPVYCTQATAELLPIMLNDAQYIYERDLARRNKRLKEKGAKALEPAYTKADVSKAIDICEGMPYRQLRRLHGHAAVRFHDAGHILGSAIVELTVNDEGKEKTLVYSGDLGKRNTVLMNDPALMQKADIVLMEGTYGNRNHREYGDTIEQLKEILAETWKRGGNVMIPAFAVGRTQELIYHLGRMHKADELDPWQIFLDSPMAIQVTEVYDRWLRQLDPDDTKHIGNSLENFLPSLNLSLTQDDSMAINEHKRGAIIIAGSGMCTGGRIRHHFRHRITKHDDTIIFIGFQARGTLGRILVDGVKKVKLFREELPVNASIETLGGFSAHAGQRGLTDWIANFNSNPKVCLVHGEPESLLKLQSHLRQQKNIDALIPAKGESISF